MRGKILFLTALSLAQFVSPAERNAQAQGSLRPSAVVSNHNSGWLTFSVYGQGRYGTATWRSGYGGIWYGADFPAASAAALGYRSFSGISIYVSGRWMYGTVYWLPGYGQVSFTDVYHDPTRRTR